MDKNYALLCANCSGGTVYSVQQNNCDGFLSLHRAQFCCAAYTELFKQFSCKRGLVLSERYYALCLLRKGHQTCRLTLYYLHTLGHACHRVTQLFNLAPSAQPVKTDSRKCDCFLILCVRRMRGHRSRIHSLTSLCVPTSSFTPKYINCLNLP